MSVTLFQNKPGLVNTWATIGVFDGVHLGHQAVISSLVQQARDAGAEPVVVTFYPHPGAVLGRKPAHFYLTSPQERADLIHRCGVGHVLTLDFDLKLARLTAQDFLRALKAEIDLRSLWVGPDFALGYKRQGTITVLQAEGENLGFTLNVIPPLQLGPHRISSSRIRDLLTQGDVHTAAAMLGRWYAVSGTVVPGDRRGRELGIPTANLHSWSERLLPLKGVYACRAHLDGRCLPAVTNVGIKPTFSGVLEHPWVETHILDFNEDIYGREVFLEFIQFIRPEERFPSAAHLVNQIQLDIAAAREVLTHAPQTPGIPA